MAADRDQLRRLVRKADSVAESATALVAKAVRELRGEVSLLSRELDVGGSAKDRSKVEDEIRSRLAALSRRIDALLSAQGERAAKEAAKAASRMTGLEVRYSAKRAEAICELATPEQGGNLAAVFTDKMAENAVSALRRATVRVLRENAVEGGGMKEMASRLRAEWEDAAARGETFAFTDRAGRTWDTAAYMQMNVRTNTMRVYNDCLADDVARATGSDLVRVSRGGGDPHCACHAWEGMVLSLSGRTKGLPTYEQAREAGCFHPNCVHTLEYVDEAADAEEVERAKAHPFDEGTDAGKRRREIEVARIREEEGLGEEAAKTRLDRADLAEAIRAGLVRADAADVVAKMTDAQVRALAGNGTPPEFVPVKKVRGGTRAEPKYEPEAWNRGANGGVVHVRRDATAEDILRVCRVEDAKVEAEAEVEKQFTHAPIPDFKTAREGMEYINATLGVHCAGFEKFDATFVRGIADVIADAKTYIGESDKLKGVWTYAEYYNELLAARTQHHLEFWDLPGDGTRRKEIERWCRDDAKRDLRRWGITKTKSGQYGCARHFSNEALTAFNGIVLNNRLDKMDRTREVQGGFKAKGCEDPIATVYHEMGHIIDYHMGLNSLGRSPMPQNETLKRIFGNREAVRTGLSQYGAKNSRETVAEAWAEYKMNPHPREIALAIGKEIGIIALRRRKKES